MAIRSNLTRAIRLLATLALAVALGLPGMARAGGLPAPEVDCVDSIRRSVASGGTNGVVHVYSVDLDGDGDVDVLSASLNDDKIAWFENDGGLPPSFIEHVISTSADGAAAVVAADLNGDGEADVVAASANDNKIVWYQNDGSTPPRFVERLISNAALNASSVHVADVDGDGLNDVLSASIDDDTIAWYRNGGGLVPTFTEVIVSITADGASSVFAAQVFDDPDDDTDDGFLELLAASRLNNRISWYQRVVVVDKEMNETILYAEFPIDTNAAGASSVFAVDVDGDTDVDVVSASANDNKIAVYSNLGPLPGAPPEFANHPVFVKVTVSSSAVGARSVHAGDLDDDGDPDLVSASRTDGKIAWYENLGGGDFGNPATNQQLIAIAPGAAAVHVTDPARAGGAHVVAASSEAGSVAANDRIAWHDNPFDDAPPSFVEREVSGGAVAPEALLAEDVDGDGDPDVIVASSVDQTIVWYENDGALAPAVPTFRQKHLLALDAAGTRDLFWADLDGDTDMDLLAALGDADSIVWYENLDGFGDFGDPATNRKDISLLQSDGASSVFAIDLDGNGIIDVLSTSADDDRVSGYPGLGGGLFGPQAIFTQSADGARSVYAVDIDDDNDVDLLFASFNDNSIRWLENTVNGPGAPVFAGHVISDAENGAREVLAADVDGDGDLDIVSASSNDDTISWFAAQVDNPELPRFGVPQAVTQTADFIRGIVATDLDGDMDVDIVSVSSADDSVNWFQNEILNPAPDLPPFVERTVTTRAESARAIAVADLDGDGFQDIVVGFLFEVAWHRGNSLEICGTFDVVGDDMEIDGQELALLGAVFGRICANGSTPDPVLDPWSGIDYNADCQVDGEDLSILTSVDVWGNTTESCAFTCP